MKVTPLRVNQFTPVSLEITFETQAELDLFGTIFNVAALIDALEEAGFSVGIFSDLRNGAKTIGADISRDVYKVLQGLNHQMKSRQ